MTSQHQRSFFQLLGLGYGCQPKNGGFLPMVKIMENPIKMDDLGGVPLFLVQHPYVGILKTPATPTFNSSDFFCFTCLDHNFGGPRAAESPSSNDCSG